jgi:NTP pyrophosphatase (non-canonical NTP hydrolase)
MRLPEYKAISMGYIEEELRSIAKRHGAPAERMDTDTLEWMFTVLAEEVGEVAKELQEDEYRWYEDTRGIIAELTQVAAIAIIMIDMAYAKLPKEN